MFLISFRAQGTMEYIVIIAIVIVISLVVVGMSGALVSDSGGSVSSNTTDLSSRSGSTSGGVAIVESATDSNGNGLIKLSNFSGESFSLTKVSTVAPDGSLIDNNFNSVYIDSSGSLAFSLSDLGNACSCATGETKKNCTFVIEYTAASGLAKSQRITTNVACVSTISSSETIIAPADLVGPVVTLSSPEDEATTETALVDFNFYVSDNNALSECALTIDGSDVNTISIVTNNAYNIISYSFSSSGNYTWDVRCTDYSNNSVTSGASRSLTYTRVLSFSAEWAKNPISETGTGYDSAYGVAVDTSGNIYVAGSTTSSSMDFGNGVTLTNRGNSDFFVVKYNSSGVAQWAKNPVLGSGTSSDYAYEVAVDSSGNVYVAGYFNSTTLGFGGVSNDVNLTYRGGSGDFFVVKYDSSGVAQWAKNPVSGSGAGFDLGNSVFVDSNGNVYVVGYFGGSLGFGGVSNDVNLTNQGSNDFFVVKYDSSGVAQGAKNPVSGSGTNADYARFVAVDSSGNVYVAGNFGSTTLSFGGVSNDVNLTYRGGGNDFFVVKYNSSGVAQWAKNPASGSGAGSDSAYGVAVDSSGNVYVAGSFAGSLGFGGVSNDVNLTNRGSDDFFVVKYDSSGVAQWAKNPASGSGTNSESAQSVAVDSSGNVYVAGYFNSTTLGFGGVGNDVNLTNRGDTDFFVVKYDSSGVAQWAKNPASGSGTNAERADSVVVDSSGNVYVAGSSNSTFVDFGNGITLMTFQTQDFFVAKYNSSGTAQWAQGLASEGGGSNDYAKSVAVDSSGNVYLVGYSVSSSLNFGNGVTLERRGNDDFFVVKYNSSGVAQWAKNTVSGSGTSYEYAYGVAVDSSGNVYVAGYFSSTTLSFGGVSNDVNLTKRGSDDFFVVKYDSSGVAQWAKNPVSGSGASYEYAYGVAVDSGGNVYVAGYSDSTTLSFGGVSNDVNLTNRGSNDFFVVKYNSSGVAQWAKNPASGSGASIDGAKSVVVDSGGNVYVAGYFCSTTLSFGGASNDVNLTFRGGEL